MPFIIILRIKLFSSSDKLSIGDVPFIVEESKPRRNQALVYYREVVKFHQLNVHPFEEVLTVKKLEINLQLQQLKTCMNVNF